MFIVFVGVLFILGRISWCKQDGDTIEGVAYSNKDDFQKRLRETKELISNLPSNKHKHVIMLVDVSISMKDDCHLIEPTVTSVLKHFENLDNVYVSLLTFGGFKVKISHISIDEFSVSTTDFECTHTTPMKTAFNRALEFVEEYENDLSVGILITDGQSTEDLEETRAAAKEFREKMGTLGEKSLGLFAIGLVDASYSELIELSSGPGYFSYYSQMNVLLKELGNSVHILDEESKNLELVEVEIVSFTYNEVGDTRDSVPIRLEIIEDSGKLGKDALGFSIEEIIRDDEKSEHDTFFYSMGNLKATLMKEASEGGRARYEFDGFFEPRNNKNEKDRYLAQNVPYDFTVVSDELNVVFQSNILNFSVSAYVRYFDSGVTILPLGEGMVGKSLWIQTIHITHSSEMRFSDVAFGKNMKGDRTTEVKPFRMSKREQDGVHGNPNTYIDIFGENSYNEEFLIRLIKGYIPKGFNKTLYEERNKPGGYDDGMYDAIPEDPEKRIEPVDAIAYLVKGEQFNSETYQKTIKQNIEMFQRINRGIPIVVIASCHDTIQCRKEDVDKQKEVLDKVCGKNCPLQDLDPYLKPDIDDKLFHTLKKQPKKDKNQWSITESIMHRVVDSRKGMITNFCDEHEKICILLEKEVKLKFGHDYEGIEQLYDKEKLDCIREKASCLRRFEELFEREREKRYCQENYDICQYPWPNIVRDNNPDLKIIKDADELVKEGEEIAKKRSDWRRNCSSSEEAGKYCKEKYDEYIELKRYCEESEFTKEMCEFYHSTDPKVVENRKKLKSTVKAISQCPKIKKAAEYDACRAEYGRYQVTEYCDDEKEEMSEFVCDCLMKVDGKPVTRFEYFYQKSEKKELFEELIECLGNHQKCEDQCRKEQVDAYCKGDGKETFFHLHSQLMRGKIDQKEYDRRLFDCSRYPSKLECVPPGKISPGEYYWLLLKTTVQNNYVKIIPVVATVLVVICGCTWFACCYEF